METTTDGTTHRARPTASPFRSIVVALLAVVAWLGLALSVVVLWSHQSLLVTDRFVATVQPIVVNQHVHQRVADKLATELVQALDVQGRAAALTPGPPALAGALSGALSVAIEGGLQRAINSVLDEPGVQQALLEAVRISHRQSLRLLRDETRVAQVQGGTLQINLFPVMGVVLDRLETRFPGIVGPVARRLPNFSQIDDPTQARNELSQALGRPLPPDFGVITVLQSDGLATAQQGLRIFDASVFMLPIVALLFGVGAVALSRRRLGTLTVLLVGGALTIAFVQILLRAGRGLALSQVANESAREVSREILATLIDPFVMVTNLLVVLMLVAALLVYLAGHRAQLNAGWEERDLGRWLGANRGLLGVSGLAVGVLVLLAFELTWGLVLLVAASELIYQVVLSRLARPATMQSGVAMADGGVG